MLICTKHRTYFVVAWGCRPTFACNRERGFTDCPLKPCHRHQNHNNPNDRCNYPSLSLSLSCSLEAAFRRVGKEASSRKSSCL